MSKEEKIREMCKLIILHISSKKVINTSFAFRNIFSNLLGFIIDIIESDFPDKKLEMLEFYLGLKRPS